MKERTHAHRLHEVEVTPVTLTAEVKQLRTNHRCQLQRLVKETGYEGWLRRLAMKTGYEGWLRRLAMQTGYEGWLRREVTPTGYNAGTAKT